MHLGVIPDGNRRYAAEHGIENKEAYRKAKKVIEDIGKGLDGYSIKEVTLYLLSEENLNRESEELQTLFELLNNLIEEMTEEYNKNGFSVNWATTKPEALPSHLVDKLHKVEKKYSTGDKQVNLLISYSGRRDILQSSKKIAENGKEFTKKKLKQHLEIKTDVDYVIRTGDNPTRECISGFPIWNSSYAEYYHIKKNFPAITLEDIETALDHFESLRRKKGK